MTPIEIRDYSHLNVFTEASVYPITLLLKRQKVTSPESITRITVMETIILPRVQMDIPTSVFCTDIEWGKYFHEQNVVEILIKFSAYRKLSNSSAVILGAATVAEAYKIKEMIIEVPENQLTDGKYKLINTGTIDPYQEFWGRRPTQYLKDKYQYPVLSASSLEKLNPVRLVQAKSHKLVVAGMSKRIEATYDPGTCLAGKSTIIILGDQGFLLFLLAVLNSKVLEFYVSTVFHSLKMAGGYINVSKSILQSIPLPFSEPIQQSKIEVLVGKILSTKKSDPSADTSALEAEIDELVYELYGLTPEEITVVEDSLVKPATKSEQADADDIETTASELDDDDNEDDDDSQ